MPKVEKPVEKAPKPRISVLERRLQNPFGEPSAPIAFKEPNRQPRWFNRQILADKIWRAKNKGWHLTYIADIVDPEQIGGYAEDATDKHITRGDRGQEVLMWMDAHEFEQIQWAKTRVNLERMKDFDKSKTEMVNAAATHYGSEAADYLNQRVGPVGSVRDTYERIERTGDGE